MMVLVFMGLSDTAGVVTNIESVQPNPLDEMKVFPNPATNNLTLVIPDMEATILNQLEIAIFNNIGQQVKQISGANDTQQIDISELSAGIYHLTIAVDGAMSGIKFIKE